MALVKFWPVAGLIGLISFSTVDREFYILIKKNFRSIKVLVLSLFCSLCALEPIKICYGIEIKADLKFPQFDGDLTKSRDAIKGFTNLVQIDRLFLLQSFLPIALTVIILPLKHIVEKKNKSCILMQNIQIFMWLNRGMISTFDLQDCLRSANQASYYYPQCSICQN